ncbi:MAG TPA: AAA family ATPase [Anaerolineales bacterium]|nr:AAA family ATPase [Anaerolineales bacterium]
MIQASPLMEIRLFGAARLSFNGQVVDDIRRKNRALLYYLAAHHQPLRRDHLLVFFWPDHERSAAQPILRTMIHDLRKHLGESFCVNDESISLAANTLIDVQDFSTALGAPTSELSTLADALALYRGDFLEGFSLVDSPQFDDWAASERERYRLMAMHGFADLARRQAGLRDYPAALESIKRALAFNPFQEDLQREVMRLLYLNGDRTGVIRQYEALRKLLDEEMGVPPMPETRDLYDAIINDTFTPAASESGQSYLVQPASDQSILPFMGREQELDALKAQLGSGKLILLEGEPGIGKTRLASEFIAAQSQDKNPAFVLQGVAHELEQILPYQPILEALRSLFDRPEWKPLSMQLDLEPVWLTELARLLPELLTQFPYIPAPTPPAQEARLWESLLQFFRALSRRANVWLFLDDLHWADTATIGWLGYFIRHIPSSLLVIATTRPVESQSGLAKLRHTLIREDQVVHLYLSTLSSAVMQKMATVLSPKYEEQLSHWLIENAEGNPFFLNELVRYAHEIGLLRTDGTLDADLFDSSPVLPATIQNLIESRLLRLSENARHVLHLAAIIGKEFEFELVQSAASLPESDVLDAIEELQAAHLIRQLQGARFAFDHSLTMQVALQDMSDARRRSFHRRVAEALESIHQPDLDPVSGLIARHFVDGNLPARAASYAFRAGQSAANLAAWVEAIAFYEQGLSLETDEAKRAPIYLALGVARFHQGDFTRASDDYRRALDLAQANLDWPLLEAAHLALNQSFLPQARYAEAVALAKELRTFGPPELALCAEFTWGTALGVESAHPMEAEQHLREAARLLSEPRDHASKITSAQIMYQLAGVVGQQGRSLEAIDLYRRALDMVNRGEAQLDILRNIMLYNNLAYHLSLVGDPSAADYARIGIKTARDKGSLSHLPFLYSTSGEIALATGDLDSAEKYFKEGLALAEQVPVPERIAGLHANLGLVAQKRGQTGLAREHLQTALRLAEQLGSRHLEVRIRIWLIPLLPPEEASPCLDTAHALAEKNGLQGLLEDVIRLERNLKHAS